MTDDEIDAVYDSVPWKDLNVASLEHVSVLRRRFARAIRNAALEEACAAIKEEDDRASAKDYMLDSDDCIAVVRSLKTKEGE